ncbi:uncharacterized protein F4807DRAFT_117380 [Annulohypoxylon truncatum]|uniref:uncharacterized protein n=1 Tax=Annulohypoxylon truncatum TaxID=327061 RepID=UPI0020089275|nr:uncharacterized protein F4807DRAFT_117380 [Annulohypoxylon truncatum]KAI1214171.1 hypothetical protein F4807DRAFT_117380 [Annulohypoxylon truncatum]
MTAEYHRTHYINSLSRQPMIGIPEIEINTANNIRQSVSLMHESQSEDYYEDVLLDVSEGPGLDIGSEIDSRHSIHSTNIAHDVRLPLRESLGISGCLIIVGGTLGSLIGFGFLLFLWAAHGSDLEATDAPMAWRRIMLNGWMGQATTLAALLIRVVTALQATVCTAMLASMFLEKQYVRKADIVQFSIIRAINDGPRKLTELIFSSPRAIFRIEAFLALSLTLGNLALQFTSTILFSDIREATIVGLSSSVQVPNYIDQQIEGIYVPAPEQESPTYRMFGEVESNMSSIPDSKGFTDSGWKQRAILPLSLADNRTAVRTFKGDAAVMSSRVSCMRPNIDGVIRTTNLSDAPHSFVYVGRFNGTLDYGSSLQDSHSDSSLCNSQGCHHAKYDCTIPSKTHIDSNTRNISSYQGGFCSVTAVGGAWNGQNHTGWKDSDEPWSNQSLIYLVYSSNMFNTDWLSHINDSQNLSSLPRTSQGEWSSFEIIPGRFLNISLCFMTFSIDSKFVEMKAKAPLHEPVGNWSILRTWNSSDVRTFFGVNELHQDHAERGILTITDLKQPENNSSDFKGDDVWNNGTRVQQTYMLLDWYFYMIISGQSGWQFTWKGCIYCDSLGQSIHPGFAMLLGDTLLTTGRAAEALLCFTTALSLQWYTDAFSSLKGTIGVDITSTKNVQTAHMCKQDSCKGIVSVAVILGLYLLTVFITTALFIRQVSYSRQGNVWHAVSQLLGYELEEALENGNDRGDDAMDKWTKEEGKHTLVRLKRVDGRIQAVRKHEVSSKGTNKRWKSWLSKFSKKKASD